MEIRNSKKATDKVPFRFLACGDTFRYGDGGVLLLKIDSSTAVSLINGCRNHIKEPTLVTIVPAHVELD